MHGLFGDAHKTWSVKSPSPVSPLADKREIFWPRDLLPGVIKDAVIFTWGYNADIDGLFTAGSQNTMKQYAENLLADIADRLACAGPVRRQTPQLRREMFVEGVC